MNTISPLKRNKHNKLVLKFWYGIGIIVLILMLFVSIYIFPRAQIEVRTDSKSLSFEDNSVATFQNGQYTNMPVPVYTYTVNENSSSSLNTTGTSTVGSPATGQVSITTLNYPNSITIPAGSVFSDSANQLNFTITTSVTIPASVSSAVVTNATFQAESIGANGNIPANSQFNAVGSSPLSASSTGQNGTTPSYTITNQSSFTGGNAKTCQSVTQTDQNNLLKSLENQLYQKAQTDLSAGLQSSDISFPSSIVNTDSQKTFDNNPGDCSSVLNLSLQTTSTEKYIKSSDLTAYATSFLQKSSGNGFTISSIGYNIKNITYNSKDNSIAYDIFLTGKKVRNIDVNNLKNNVVKHSVSSASSYIKSIPGVEYVYIKVSPVWFSIFRFLPFRRSQINVIIE